MIKLFYMKIFVKSIIHNFSNIFIKSSNKKRYFLIALCVIILHLILIIFWPFSSFLVKLPDIYSENFNQNEFSPAEIMQAILYFIAFVTCLKKLLIKNSERKIFFIILIITFILFAEETSWMQHYLKYSLPLFQNINAQNEVNIHNLFLLESKSLRSGNLNLEDLLLNSQNLFRILFCFYFFFLPLISFKKAFKKYLKKYIFFRPSKFFTISLSISLLFNIILTLFFGYPSELSNALAELRELIYATYICLYIIDLRIPY